MARYDVPDKFNPEKGITRVKFGRDGTSLLDIELDELQKIAQYRDDLSNQIILSDGFVKDFNMTYTSGTLTVPADIVVVQGKIAEFKQNMTLAGLVSGDKVYLALWEETVAAADTLKRYGNQNGGTNISNSDIIDSEQGTETARRVQQKIALVKSNADATKKYIDVATITGIGTLTDTRKTVTLNLLPDLSATSPIETKQGATEKANTAESRAKAASLPITGGVLTGALTTEQFGMYPKLSAKPSTDPLSSYPAGITVMITGGEAGYPDGYGVCLTVNISVARNVQLFFIKNSSRMFIRTWHDVNNAWTAWAEEETTAGAQSKADAAKDAAIAFAKSYGLGGPSVNYYSDLNTLKTNGFYYANTAVTNRPSSFNGFVIVQSNQDPNFVTQLYVNHNDGKTFSRQCTSGTWGAWIEQETVPGAQAKANTAETNAKNASISKTSGGNISSTAATPFGLERTGGTLSNINQLFKLGSVQRYLGINSAGEFLIGSDPDLAGTGKTLETTEGAQAKATKAFNDATKNLEDIISSRNNVSETLKLGTNVVNAPISSVLDVDIAGSTLVNMSQTGLKAGGSYVLSDKKSKVRAGKNTAVQTGVSKFQVPVMTKADFSGKVAGSVVENPHVARTNSARVNAANASLLSPTSDQWVDLSQGGIGSIQSLNNVSTNPSVTGNGFIGQILFSFNLIEHVERTIGLIPRATVAEKTQWLKDNLNKLTANWHGYGTGPAGNKANFQLWNGTSWTTSPVTVHTNGTVSKIGYLTSLMSNVQPDGFVHFLAYAEPSDGTTASTIYTDFVELEVELKAGTQLEKPTLIRVANFEGKVSGSTVENPHRMNRNNGHSVLQTPTGSWGESDSVQYSWVSKLDGQSVPSTRGASPISGDIAQHLFSYNIIEEIERQVGQIPRGTLAEKVQWVKDNLNLITFNWTGYGTSPVGNKATITGWVAKDGVYSSTKPTNTSTAPSRVSYTHPNPDLFIDSSGFIHFLAFAEPSNGTTASTIYTDYAELEIWMEPTAVISPKFPLYEVEQAEYDAILNTWDEEEVARRYPLVEGVEHVQNPIVTIEGDNLIPPFYEWNYLHPSGKVINPYEYEIDSTGTYQGVNIVVDVIPNKDYSVTAEFKGRIAVSDINDTTINGVDNTTYGIKSVAFNSGNRSKLRIYITSGPLPNGKFTFKNPILTLGDKPKAFVPRNPSYLYAPVKLGKIGSAKDRLYRDGQDWKLRKEVEKDVVLDGSLTFFFHNDYAGCKSVLVPTVANKIALGNTPEFYVSKYDGRKLGRTFSTVVNTEDYTYGDSNNVAISISDATSGWSDTYTPSQDEIRAYFNGWAVKTMDGSNKPTAWKSVVDGTDAPTQTLTYVSKNYAPRYTPYTLSYALATPKTEVVTDLIEGELVVNGMSQVSVDSGVIVRERVVPATSASLAHINRMDGSVKSELKNKVLKIINIYKNGVLDTNKWILTFTIGQSFGAQHAYISLSDFDPTAEYAVTYQVLDKHLFTAPPIETKVTYDSTLGAVVNDLVSRFGDIYTLAADAEINSRKYTDEFKKFISSLGIGVKDSSNFIADANMSGPQTPTGVYYTSGTTANLPVSGGGALIHLARFERPVQIYLDYLTNRLFTRGSNASGYLAWKESETTDGAQSKATAAENNAKNWAKSFGLGDVAKDVGTVDMNTVTTTGFYRGSGNVNRPPALPGYNVSGWFYYIVLGHDSAWALQIAIDFNTGTIQQRVKSANSWGAWSVQETTSGAQSKADAALATALSRTHDRKTIPGTNDLNDFKETASFFTHDTGLGQALNTPIGTLALGSARVFSVRNTGSQTTRIEQEFSFIHPTSDRRKWWRLWEGSTWSAWEQIETVAGAQAKANTAETNAKNASIPRTGDNEVPGTLAAKNFIAKRGYKSTSTGADKANYWTKIAEVSVTSLYGMNYGTFKLEAGEDGSSYIKSCEVSYRLKQQNAMGQAPNMDMSMGMNDFFRKENLKAVLMENSSTKTRFDIYVQISASFEQVRVYPLTDSTDTGTVAYFESQGLIQTLPAGTGTTITCRYTDSGVRNLTIDGGATLAGVNVETTAGAQAKADAAELDAINWVKSFGLGTEAKIITGTDLNSLDATGFYMGDKLLNSPSGPTSSLTAWYYIVNIKHNDQYKLQTAYRLNTGANTYPEMWTRKKDTNVWGDWSQTVTVGGGVLNITAPEAYLNGNDIMTSQHMWDRGFYTTTFIHQDEDLNTLTENGRFFLKGNNINAPTNSWGFLEVYYYSDVRIKQVFTRDKGVGGAGEEVYYRMKYDSTWTAWSKVGMIEEVERAPKVKKLNKDGNGIFTKVEYRRKGNNVLYQTAELSGGTSPQYTTKTVKYYAENGTTVTRTDTFTLTYDSDGDLIEEN